MALSPLISDPNDPFAQFKAAQGLQAPPMPTQHMTSPMPQISQGLQPLVSRQPTFNEGQENRLQQGIQSYQDKQAQKPQGFWQNVRHVAATIGNIAGDIVAPQQMELIPGTQLHGQIEQGQRIHSLAGLQEQDRLQSTNDADIGYKKAQTAGELETTAEAPGKAKSEEELQGAQTYRAINPIPTSPDMGTYTALTSMGMSPSDALKEIEKDKALALKPTSMEHVPLQGPNGPVMGNFHADTGTYTDAAGNPITNPRPVPPTPMPVQMFSPGPNGQMTLNAIRPGQTVAPGSVSASGLNSENVPTAATRTMAETAPKVLDLANRSEQLIDQQLSSLGPLSSRWNEYMTGKIGAPNPEFTRLRTNIGLLQTSLMRMHVGARGGEQIMEHFRDLIDVSKQDPQNLKAALDEIKAYAVEVGRSGGQGVAAETDKAAGTSQPKENDTKTNGAGIKVVYKNGKWGAA